MTTKTLKDNYRMAGLVTGINELTCYDREDPENTRVINLNVETVEQNEFGIEIKKERRVTLFHKKALEVANQIDEGDYVFFDECSERQRSFENKRGQERTVIESTANQFAKITKEQCEKVQKMLAKQMASMQDEPDFAA